MLRHVCKSLNYLLQKRLTSCTSWENHGLVNLSYFEYFRLYWIIYCENICRSIVILLVLWWWTYRHSKIISVHQCDIITFAVINNPNDFVIFNQLIFYDAKLLVDNKEIWELNLKSMRFFIKYYVIRFYWNGVRLMSIDAISV